MNPIRAAIVVAVMLVSGCSSMPEDFSSDQGILIGAAGGAATGALLGDGGIILPALGAVGGAVIGEEAAENDPLFD